jgi:macrolide transport system ATP-binding/permease protein
MDFRYALRMLARAPGFTAVAVLTLALRIGINTVVFTLYEAVALKPIAARAPGELLRIAGTQGTRKLDPFSWKQYEQLRGQAQSVADVLATSDLVTVAGRGEVLRARIVSANYFDMLGVAPALGRGFAADDRTVAVLSYDYWTKRLGGDTSALGRTIQVQNGTLQVVGVAPRRFAGTGLPPRMPDLWVPAAAQATVLPGVDWMRDENARGFQLLARRKAAVRVEQAAAELDVIGRQWPLVDGKPAKLTARAATFFQAESGEFETFADVCLVLVVAVGLILLIGSVNLVNLLLARNVVREREFAIRLAVGASRWRVARLLTTESMLTGLGGGALGLIVSLWACEWIRGAIVNGVERITAGALGVHLDITPDWRVFAYTLSISIATGMAIGIWPALRASRQDLGGALKLGFAGGRGGRRRRNVLIAAQVAACLILLAAAGLLLRGVWASRDVVTGFDDGHVMIVNLNANAMASTDAARTELLRRAMERIRAVPGVTSVAWGERGPYLGHGIAGFRNERGAEIACLFNLVSESYLEAVGIPLVAGRTFTPDEAERKAPVVIVSDVAARQAWPGQDPIGHTVSGIDWLKRETPHTSFTVIGVAKGVRSTYLSKPDEAYLYFPKGAAAGYGGFVLRRQASAEAVKRGTMEELGKLNPNLPSQTFMAEVDGAPMQIQRLMAQAPAAVAFGLGVAALLLAAVGIFGLVSQLVAQRTKEIAIRVSLGAQNRDVMRMVLRQTLRPVVVGSVAGLAGVIGISALLQAMVRVPEMPDLTYGAGAFGPLPLAGAMAVLTAAVLAASIVPLRKATRITPAEALRNE